MSNILTSNPLQFDTAGATSAIVGDTYITSIIVIASEAPWSCVIHDKASGDVIFWAASSITNHQSIFWSPARPLGVKGIYVTTMTNVALVLVYTSGDDN